MAAHLECRPAAAATGKEAKGTQAAYTYSFTYWSLLLCGEKRKAAAEVAIANALPTGRSGVGTTDQQLVPFTYFLFT